jgi:hypothetical protein
VGNSVLRLLKGGSGNRMEQIFGDDADGRWIDLLVGSLAEGLLPWLVSNATNLYYYLQSGLNAPVVPGFGLSKIQG